MCSCLAHVVDMIVSCSLLFGVLRFLVVEQFPWLSCVMCWLLCVVCGVLCVACSSLCVVLSCVELCRYLFLVYCALCVLVYCY